ncbi:MAG: hypothetical protein HOO91_09245 [Bacteroidales bacterium]|nr:hypothetical protein [Bacteroidales bacterium]
MANKRIFVAFAIEDEITKNLFTGQAKNKSVPYDFIDMSVKEPFDEKWKTNCRTRIKGCDGFIALISKNTKKASGELWEIDCAKDEKIPMMGIYIGGATLSDKPANMNGIPCKEWTWDNVSDFIESL